jgi:hypothetical protein
VETRYFRIIQGEDIVVDEVTKVILGQKLGILMQKDDQFLDEQNKLEQQLEPVAQLTNIYMENPQAGASPLEVLDLTSSKQTSRTRLILSSARDGVYSSKSRLSRI